MLVNVYSYHMMEKSVSCCCVHGRQVVSDPVTYVHTSSIGTIQNCHGNISVAILYGPDVKHCMVNSTFMAREVMDMLESSLPWKRLRL